MFQSYSFNPFNKTINYDRFDQLNDKVTVIIGNAWTNSLNNSLMMNVNVCLSIGVAVHLMHRASSADRKGCLARFRL